MNERTSSSSVVPMSDFETLHTSLICHRLPTLAILRNGQPHSRIVVHPATSCLPSCPRPLRTPHIPRIAVRAAILPIFTSSSSLRSQSPAGE